MWWYLLQTAVILGVVFWLYAIEAVGRNEGLAAGFFGMFAAFWVTIWVGNGIDRYRRWRDGLPPPPKKTVADSRFAAAREGRLPGQRK